MRWGVFWIGGYNIMRDKDTPKREIIKFNDIPHKYPQSIFNKKGHTIRTQQHFIKCSSVAIAILSNETFTPIEIKILFGMLQFVKLDKVCSGALVYDGIPINKTRLMELLGNPNINTFDACIERLEKKELIMRVQWHNSIIYYVNPFVFMNGEITDPTTFALFYQSKWNVYGD